MIKLFVKRKLFIFLLFILLVALIGCSSSQSSIQKKDFVLQIHTNQESYTKAEAIQLWTTLKYIGDASEVTIDHASSYARFEIEQIDGSSRYETEQNSIEP